MRFLSTFCAVISHLGMRLLVERRYIYWSTGLGLQSSTGYGMRLLRHCHACCWSIGLGLQSFMGCVYFCTAGAPINLLVLVYIHPGDASITASSMRVTGLLVLVYNHPRDASIPTLLVHLSFYWSWLLVIGLWGCVYFALSLQSSVYGYWPIGRSTSTLRIQLSVYRSLTYRMA